MDSDSILLPSRESCCAILVGQAADRKKAQSMVRAAKRCPYMALYTAKDSTIIGVFTLPKSEQRWIEYPQVKPAFLEFKKVTTVITDQILATSPWSRGEVEPDDELTPCKKRCDKCERYPEHCSGCPATIFYFAAE